VTAHAAPGETFLAEIREQPQALLRLIEQAPVYEEAARAAVEPTGAAAATAEAAAAPEARAPVEAAASSR